MVEFIPVMYYSLFFFFFVAGEMFPLCAKSVLRQSSKGTLGCMAQGAHSQQSVLCNLKWLPLSSRLLASCCPKC